MTRVLVTGVGAIIGYGIIRSLRAIEQNIHIVGSDIYSDAVGQYWCDAFLQAQPAVSETYPEFLAETINKYDIELVLFGVEQEIIRIAQDRSRFENIWDRLAINNADLVLLSRDKWLMHCDLRDHGFDIIPTEINGDFELLSGQLGLPYLLKPRRSYASKGIMQIHTQADHDYLRAKWGGQFMVQQIVGDDTSEYTVGVFGFGDGTHGGGITFRRQLSGEGATSKAEVVNLSQLNALVDDLVRVYQPIGPTNLQFRQHEGRYLLLEINPRISSSTSLRTAFGFNESRFCLDYYVEGRAPTPPNVRSTGQAIRYIEDMILNDSNHL